ncbi:MAG TPA: hypothetical protein VGH33_23630 [Isosphaeraceae bacterium]
MATAAQIAANQANAQKSTGPKTPPGKAASSRNATRHGLSTTAALAASESDKAYLEDEKARWRVDFDPRGAEEEHLFEVVVAESIRQRRCTDAYFALCRDHGHKAQLQWDDDRRRQADDLALKLGKSPHAVARQLEATWHGAALKIELWHGLASSLERHKTWTDAQRSLALDLLGIRPELRDAETPADPIEGDVLGARRALIASEVARLETLRDGVLAERDDHERVMAESTVGAELTKPLQLIDRYERAAWNRARWAWRKLDEARKARSVNPPGRASTSVSVVHVSAAKPAPRPMPGPAAATPARDVTSPEPTPAPPRPLNRRQRRAQAAMARRAG